MYSSSGTLLAVFTAGLGGLVSASSLSTNSTTFKNSMAFHKSFLEATLFTGELDYGEATVDVALVCVDCYITGKVTTELDIVSRNTTTNSTNSSNSTSTNVTSSLTAAAHVFLHDVVNITDTVVDDVTAALKNDTEALLAAPSLSTLTAFFHNLTRPTMDVDFELVDGAAALADLPEFQFALTLDAFEVYVQTQLAVSGSATSTVNLFTSETDFGIRHGNDLELGVVLTVDLILSAAVDNGTAGDGITIDSGFHLKMHDGLALHVDLFGRNVTDIVFNGGIFEFLPVTVSATQLALNAIVRVGVHAGIILASGDLAVHGIDLAAYSAGVETVAFADVANLTMSIGTGATEEDACSSTELAVEEMFGFDIGADAGASVQIGDVMSWGIGPSTMLPVFYTTVAQCAGRPTSTRSPARRAASTSASSTTVLTTTAVYSATGCRSAGLVNCPVSLQTTAVTTATTTTTVTVSHGGTATWPATTATTVLASLATFGHNAKAIGFTASGVPLSYVPTTSSTRSSSQAASSTAAATGITVAGHHLTSKQEHIAIGVGVGVGVLLVAGAVATAVFLAKRKKRQLVIPRSSVAPRGKTAYVSVAHVDSS